jgi:hypothetical protein
VLDSSVPAVDSSFPKVDSSVPLVDHQPPWCTTSPSGGPIIPKADIPEGPWRGPCRGGMERLPLGRSDRRFGDRNRSGGSRDRSRCRHSSGSGRSCGSGSLWGPSPSLHALRYPLQSVHQPFSRQCTAGLPHAPHDPHASHPGALYSPFPSGEHMPHAPHDPNAPHPGALYSPFPSGEYMPHAPHDPHASHPGALYSPSPSPLGKSQVGIWKVRCSNS